MMWDIVGAEVEYWTEKNLTHGNILIIVCFDSWLIAEGDHWAGIKV